MEVNKTIVAQSEAVTEQETIEKEAYKGALFSTLLFVGGTIVLFIILLLVFFITRI